MLPALLTLVLVCGALVAVALPLIGRKAAALSPAVGRLQELLDERDTLFNGLRELENDRGLGSLARVDYERLREDYETQLALVLMAVDERARGLEEDLEAEIARERRREA
jgi:hypothetical protein